MTTKNGDMPAMPITSEQAQDADMWGMSKREMMAMHMMASLTSVYFDTVQEYETGADLVKCQAETAVEMADSLLAELERTNATI